jgi:hypothetical protein
MAMTVAGRERLDVGGVIDALVSVVENLDVASVSGADAARLTELFARGERLCSNAKALCAKKASDCSMWQRSGARSPQEWLAKVSGGGLRQAQDSLEIAEAMRHAPALADACRSGELSFEQASQIASVAKHEPAAAETLVRTARSASFKGLKSHCQAVRNTARSAREDQERLAAAFRSRYVRDWVDRDGAGHLEMSDTPDRVARVLAAMKPFERAAFERARKSGSRQSRECYRADALVELAEAATTTPNGDADSKDPDLTDDSADGTDIASGGQGGRVGPAAMIIAVVDHSALVRGYTTSGETCEIDGVGPAAVSAVKELSHDAFLAAVVKDRTDIRRVVHLGRSPTAAQRSALIVRDRTCVIPSCDVSDGLEIDHVTGWEITHKTTLDDLARLCKHHHHQKSYQGWTLTGPPGAWTWRPPPQGIPPGPFDDDGIHLHPNHSDP